ncbi:glycerol-3-phosphate dehydrogenase/oxidase [Thiohalomonas denitrificans]|uniref:glycerol-3-phosphate dehydrogenase/oxidase n=1 Tax=Thiohalomonas denitrificans TaxID=415747 RepID=UPI0026EFCA0D|nr:glycerol-3-phosphate dehydrogenase/oxidase [Thiohalomonas denitrificans]
MKRVAVIGGGINGVMTAWELAKKGHAVQLFEKGTLMSATSSASTKLLHGGLRYLEHGRFSLVREALAERAWWIEQAPHLARPLPILLPIYRKSSRSALKMKIGLTIYDGLAGKACLGRHKKLTPSELLALLPELKPEGLVGGYRFFDGQMDDRALGLWAAERASEAGVSIREKTAVERVTRSGQVSASGDWERYDLVYNVTGPWAEQLLTRSGIESSVRLRLVRGSHLVFDFPIAHGAILEVPGQRRVAFILPYQGHTLVGTTEVAQRLDEPVECSAEETSYLIGFCRRYLHRNIGKENIKTHFAGLRPLVQAARDAGSTSRESAFEQSDRVITVFGGKWTASRALASRAAAMSG